MMRARWLLVLSLLIPGLANTALASNNPDAMAALDAMSRSFRELNYRGLFTYERGQQLTSLRIAHAVIDGAEYERVQRLDGDDVSFTRHGHGPDCIHPGARLLRSGMTAPGGAGLENYEIRSVGEERLAGHDGVRIQIIPRDRFRFGYLLVLDAESSMLLKSEVHDSAGRLIERFQFVELEVGASMDASEFDVRDGRVSEAGHQVETTGNVDGVDWQVGWLPSGFEPSGGVTAIAGDHGQAVQTRVYSDGLAVFSVFVEPAGSVNNEPGRASQGATVAYSVQRGAGRLITVVGEIPPETAQLVANSINFPDSNG